MPDIAERLALAVRTMLALTGDAEMPPKIGVQPRAIGAFAHAMPALLRGASADGSDDLLGMKWVVGVPSNVAAGLPAVHGTTILSDARTGQPRAILDAGALTAARTAAVSGLAIRLWGPRPAGAATTAPGAQPGALTVAFIGAGAQARSHLPVVAHLLPHARLVLCDRDVARAETLAHEIGLAAGALGIFHSVRATSDPAEAIVNADVVLTLVSFGRDRQAIPEGSFSPSATIIAVDYDMSVPATLAASAGLFLVDHREQYLATRTETTFVGYPDSVATIGEAIRARVPRPGGRVLITHLGVGLADVVFGDAVQRIAADRGIGTILDR